MGAPHQPSWAAASCFCWEGDRDRVLVTALVSGYWGWAPGLQYGPEGKAEEQWGRETCLHPVPIPAACKSACTPACALAWTPCSHAHILLPRLGCGAGGRYFRGSGDPCYPPAQRSRKAATVTEANKGRVRPGRWATAGTCWHLPWWHPCPSQWGKEQGGTVPMPRNGGPPCTPMSGSRGHVGCPEQCCQPVLCTPVLSQQLPGCPHGVQQCGLRVPIPAPCWAGPHLGWGSGRKR